MKFGSFGGEKPPQPQIEKDDEDLIARVMQQAPAEPAEKREVTVADGADESLHAVKSSEDVRAERDAAANPHGFTEVAPTRKEEVDEEDDLPMAA